MTTALEQRSEANSGLGVSGQVAIQFEDEGTPIGSAGGVTNVDFVGAGVTATHAAGQVTVTINGAAAPDAWPIGSVFISVVSTNPNTLLGYGTWAAFGAGRVMVGLDAGDADFDTVEETGGAKTAPHTHGAGTLATDTFAAHTHGVGTLLPSAHSGTAVGDHAAHTHGVGTLLPSAHSGTAVAAHSASEFNHKHDITTAGNATISAHSGTAVGDHGSHVHQMSDVYAHQHPIQPGNLTHSHPIAAGQGSHVHPLAVNTTDGSGAYADRATTSGSATISTDAATLPAMVTSNWTPGAAVLTDVYGSSPAYTDGPTATLTHSVTQPSAHTLGGGTQLADGASSPTVSHSVTQPGAHTMSGSTGNPSATLAHSVTQPSAHTMSGSTASDGAHGHSVNSGSTGSTAPSVVQPYIVCYFWKRTA